MNQREPKPSIRIQGHGVTRLSKHGSRGHPKGYRSPWNALMTLNTSLKLMNWLMSCGSTSTMFAVPQSFFGLVSIASRRRYSGVVGYTSPGVATPTASRGSRSNLTTQPDRAIVPRPCARGSCPHFVASSVFRRSFADARGTYETRYYGQFPSASGAGKGYSEPANAKRMNWTSAKFTNLLMSPGSRSATDRCATFPSGATNGPP